MRSFRVLAARPDFTVTAVTCRDDHKGWSEVESQDGYRVVLVRRGRFRRRIAGVPAEVDPTLAYVGLPGDEEHFAHPAGGDVCTSVRLTPALWRALAGDAARVTRPVVYVDPRLDLTHRRVLTAAGAGDLDYALTERLMDLLSRVVEQVVTGPTPMGASPAKADHALVAAARAVIGEGDPAANGLFPLAELLGVSPYRLSRAFTRELGVSLTRYRNRVRLGRALDRLEGGESSLATLAADLGFADQAHLCRTVREHLGHTPTALRRLLAEPT
ncbi:AraC family transcriptional regulator [Micromonospora sp. NBC_00389]|uniref:helix-turn-helix domain-containing protein n=1 Tax=Micromonospora sp. NBC_00389 TaxID=2903586 RepID=UPI002E1C1513